MTFYWKNLPKRQGRRAAESKDCSMVNHSVLISRWVLEN